MTKEDLAKVKVGSVIQNAEGQLMVVDRIEEGFWILKWVNDDGTLSKGEDWCVDSHLLDLGYNLILTTFTGTYGLVGVISRKDYFDQNYKYFVTDEDLTGRDLDLAIDPETDYLYAVIPCI